MVLELLQLGIVRQALDGHDGLLSHSLMSACSGHQKEVDRHIRQAKGPSQVGTALSADRRRPARRPLIDIDRANCRARSATDQLEQHRSPLAVALLDVNGLPPRRSRFVRYPRGRASTAPTSRTSPPRRRTPAPPSARPRTTRPRRDHRHSAAHASVTAGKRSAGRKPSKMLSGARLPTSSPRAPSPAKAQSNRT